MLRSQSDAALILMRNISIAVGDTLEFAFIYGYAADAGAMKALISKYLLWIILV